MRAIQHTWHRERGWSAAAADAVQRPDLVLAFGPRPLIAQAPALLEERFPGALQCGCSTSGSLSGDEVRDDLLCATAVWLERSRARMVSAIVSEASGSFAAGERLSAQLAAEGLKHVLVFSDGLKVNGSALVRGLSEALPAGVTVTGGLAGDDSSFEQTLVLEGGRACAGLVTAVGFYGAQFRVSSGCAGGWDPFGMDRVITKSKNNVLYELDGKSALELYKSYLAGHASELPSSGLRFPLAIRGANGADPLVRTLLAVSESEQSLTFAGDMPEGCFARLMKASPHRLVDGAAEAAEEAWSSFGQGEPALVLLVSCVGRRLVMGQRVDEEIEVVRDRFGSKASIAGFYSYGELAPSRRGAACELHNQTMTITALGEDS